MEIDVDELKTCEDKVLRDMTSESERLVYASNNQRAGSCGTW